MGEAIGGGGTTPELLKSTISGGRVGDCIGGGMGPPPATAAARHTLGGRCGDCIGGGGAVPSITFLAAIIDPAEAVMAVGAATALADMIVAAAASRPPPPPPLLPRRRRRRVPLPVVAALPGEPSGDSDSSSSPSPSSTTSAHCVAPSIAPCLVTTAWAGRCVGEAHSGPDCLKAASLPTRLPGAVTAPEYQVMLGARKSMKVFRTCISGA